MTRQSHLNILRRTTHDVKQPFLPDVAQPFNSLSLYVCRAPGYLACGPVMFSQRSHVGHLNSSSHRMSCPCVAVKRGGHHGTLALQELHRIMTRQSHLNILRRTTHDVKQPFLPDVAQPFSSLSLCVPCSWRSKQSDDLNGAVWIVVEQTFFSESLRQDTSDMCKSDSSNARILCEIRSRTREMYWQTPPCNTLVKGPKPRA